MAHQIRNIFTFDNEYEIITDLSNNLTIPDDNHNLVLLSNPIQHRQVRPMLSYWRPCPKLQNLYDRYVYHELNTTL